ncbi:Dehydrogenase [Anatilimnocola aggregata]|uniref:Dehydrogenase n=1 Tax=Anatilimnocola aggregata TaxID=2528021 RepID=A0A517Y8F0_9BACT|nr:Gfo/Idh/MocA family oxidoreductase [Anatilimnocola aggregata]QDU26475.1 Dehydrogenase [Anatilimnocola aggregata]
MNKNSPEPLRLAVIGAGHLGRIHARLAKQLPHTQLVAVVDPVEASRTAVATELQVPTHADYHPLLAQFDAAIVATPTQFHHAVVMELLERGKHVLVEKPIASTSAEAEEMVSAADERDLVLQVGHVERFNPAWVRIRPHLTDATFIAARRLAPYTCRSTDVGVVLDLMIHDLDLVLSLVPEEVTQVQACGAAVIGPHEDWAEARLSFSNGCVAQLSASRVSPVVVRSLEISNGQSFAAIDFGSKTARTLEPSLTIRQGQIDIARLSPTERVELKDQFFDKHLHKEDLAVTDHNAILEEQKDFVQAVKQHSQPQVTGIDGWRALETAERIVAAIAASQRERSRSSSQHALRGPHWSHAAKLAAARRKAG